MVRNWAELPAELLGQILKRLCILSIYSFKLVCKPWCSAMREEAYLSFLRPAPSPPWLTLHAASDSEDEKKKKDYSACFFNPTNRKVYCIEKKKTWPPPPEEAVCIGSSQGWLAFIDRRCNIYLSNPFKPDDESSIRVLPPFETLPCIRGVERSSSSSIVNFKYCVASNKTYITSPDRLYRYFITKLVLSSVPSSGEYTVMAIHGETTWRQLVFCKSGDASWTSLDGTLQRYQDIHYSSNDQRFYACGGNSEESLEIWDLRDSSPKSTCIRFLPSIMRSNELSPECFLRKYLLELHGDILLVARCISHHQDRLFHYLRSFKTLCFDVYKLNRDSDEKPSWVQIKCLGDNVLFLGINNAMAFSARDFPGLKGSSIYFTDYTNGLSYAGGHDFGIFNLSDNSIHPCYYPVNFEKISPTPVWISPNPW